MGAMKTSMLSALIVLLVSCSGASTVQEKSSPPSTAVKLEKGPVHPARDAEIEKCRQCKGNWGRHGLSQSEFCICRTTDHNKECYEESDCQGSCVYQRTDTVAESRTVPCNDGEDCIVRSPRIRHVGVCSEFVMFVGCHSVIRTTTDPKTGEERPEVIHICAD